MTFKRFILLLGSLCVLVFTVGKTNLTKAAVLTGSVDTTGSITGVAGATYYNATSWQDMIDTYRSVTPTTASKNTVYLNISADIAGSGVINTTNTVISDKSLTIIGNNHTLYLDNDTNYLTAQNITGNDSTTRAFGSSGTISSTTKLMVKKAKIINNVTGGIFQMKGANAQATVTYEDVTVTNGAAIYGAQPIRNDNGKVLFQGNNTFNVLQNNQLSDATTAGIDNQGEWIQGGGYTEVLSGTTTLNQSWGNDQPYNVYYTNNGSLLQVNAGASLVWNLNKTATLYADEGAVISALTGPLTWNINGNFIINGTVNTASTSSTGWFMSLDILSAWNVNVGQNATFKATTGGVINLGSLLSIPLVGLAPVKWNFAQGSSVLLNNLNPGQNLISSAPGLTSGLTMNDPKVVTLNTNGGAVFATTVLTFPITITGGGLRTHSSSSSYVFDGSYDLVRPNRGQINASSTDIWYRKNTGTLTTFNPTLQVTSLSPNNYSSTDVGNIASGKYISWYQPNGLEIDGSLSNMNRSFNISLDPTAQNGTPVDGSWSPLINGNASEVLVIGDDRGQVPSLRVQVKMLQNNFSNGLQYYWVDPTTKAAQLLSLNTAVQIVSLSSNTLPDWIKATGAGSWYTMTFSTDSGLNLKANNSLLAQTNVNAGTFQYTVVDGPT